MSPDILHYDLQAVPAAERQRLTNHGIQQASSGRKRASRDLDASQNLLSTLSWSDLVPILLVLDAELSAKLRRTRSAELGLHMTRFSGHSFGKCYSVLAYMVTG